MVEQGDYLNKLAIKYRCSVEDIMDWNNLTSLNLTSGSILKIWTPNQSNTSMTDLSEKEQIKQVPLTQKKIIYTVQKGDTIYSISKKFSGTTIADIMKENNLTHENSLVPGTILKINTLIN